MKKFILFTTAAMMTMAASAASGVSIVNGSFEIGTDPGSFTTVPAGGTNITGWTVGGFGVDYIGTYWMASDGVRSIDLSALNSGSVSQTLATEVGKTYTVTFDLSGNPDGGPGQKITVASISGSLPGIETYLVTPANSRTSMNWQTYHYTFTAFDTASTLTFASATYTPYGPALDNVSILAGGGIGSSVPEPASWAMLLAGFGMVGVSVRRRKGTRVVTA